VSSVLLLMSMVWRLIDWMRMYRRPRQRERLREVKRGQAVTGESTTLCRLGLPLNCTTVIGYRSYT
jgi:hypothetical protein